MNAAAERLGLNPGLALAEARAMRPDLAVAAEDAAADARLLAALADACGRYTPLVALDGGDGLLLDIGGCAHLFGGEAALLADVAARFARLGFALAAGIADTIGAAWAVARHGADGQPSIVPGGGERAALAPLRLAALRLSPESAGVLARVGLRRVGDIVDLPRAPLAARFGEPLLRRLDQALGREREPLNPRLPVPPYFTEQRFAEPIGREEDVLASVQRLAARLSGMLEKRGEGARRIELSLFRTDGAVRRIAVGSGRPLRDPQEMRALFAERLAALADEFDPGFGFDLARLAILAAEAAPPEQIGLGGREDSAAIERLTDRLAARLGSRRVGRMIAQDSHIPEIAAALVPAQSSAARADVAAAGWNAFRRFRTETGLSQRPLRLFTQPEPIDAVASVPEGPPLRFRWRRALHEVAAAEGPERIEGMWWSEDAEPARDYFRVEDFSGARFWVFRAGLYRNPDDAPRWFLHGLFA